MSSVKGLDKATEIELVKIKKLLYDSLDMLFEKLGKQNQDLEELGSELKGVNKND